MADPGRVVFSWPMASQHGWGVRGLAYSLNWPGIAVSASGELSAMLPPGDPRAALLAERMEQSRRVQSQIIAPGGVTVEFSDPVLVALGNGFEPQTVAFGRKIRGRPHIGCPVFEDVALAKENAERLREYDVVVVASRWNQQVLDDLGIDAVLCHEGIDPLLFNPSVRRSRDDSKFRVFTGGKAEYRKGQDLVIEAFKVFAEKHDDAVLVAAWGSPFSAWASDFEGKWSIGAPPGLHIGRPNYHAWVQRAGVKPHQFEWIEPRANGLMPEVYGGVDAAIFPNRCEGGTNFVAMECVACGVPTQVNLAYGQEDLVFEVAHGYEGEGAIEQMVGFLEAQYERREPAAPLSPYWTWARHCGEMAEIVSDA